MQMSRLLCGIAVLALVGVIGTRVNDPGPTPPQHAVDSAITRPEPDVERADPLPSRPGRARAPRNPGGLPARDTSARRGQAVSMGAPSSSFAPSTVDVSHLTPRAPVEAAIARDVAIARRPAAAIASAPSPDIHPSSIDDPAAPAEKERARSRGIAGSVLEKSGAPAAGVTVGLKARRLFDGSAGASAPQTVTTDGRGNFDFGAVAEGEYEIHSEKSDRYRRASALVRSGTDAAVLVVEPLAETTVAIRGVVESAGGGPLTGVRVEVIGESISATTDARGAFAVRVPAHARVEQTALRFRRSGYRDHRWAMTDGLRPNDHEVIANVRLEPDTAGVSVGGVVVGTNGTPVARARVQLDSAARGRGYRAQTDGTGRFILTNVETGADYRLWVRAQAGFKDGVLENVRVDEGAQPLEIELTPIGIATLKGRMVTPDGKGVPGFTMWLTAAYGSRQRAVAVTSDNDGRFEVADLPEGPVALQTRAAPSISVSGINLSAAGPNDVSVVIDLGAHRLEGSAQTSEGAPAAGASISLEWSGASGGITSRATRETIADADGSFVFTQLGTGMHVMTATLGGRSVRIEYAIGPGSQPVQITFPEKRGRQ